MTEPEPRPSPAVPSDPEQQPDDRRQAPPAPAAASAAADDPPQTEAQREATETIRSISRLEESN